MKAQNQKGKSYVTPGTRIIRVSQENVVCASPGDGLVIVYDGFNDHEEEW